MENLPVEVVGNILSRLMDARDVVIASGTCKNWREAYRNHLHRLSFSPEAWPFYRTFDTGFLEGLIRDTIIQTTGLQDLSIMTDNDRENSFSASAITAWLTHTSETLRRLSYNVRSTPYINVLNCCGWRNLETLLLVHCPVLSIVSDLQLPSLKSLSLRHVSISDSDLTCLINACPKIETLELVWHRITVFGDIELGLTIPTIKNIYIEGVVLTRIILEVNSIERLHVKDSDFILKLVGNETLKHFKLEKFHPLQLDISEAAENLESVDVDYCTFALSELHPLISRAQKLRKLRLWDVIFCDGIVDLETIAVGFPQLTHLSLGYYPREGFTHYSLQATSQLESVTVLELGWTLMNDGLPVWVEGVLERCPNLRKLIIYVAISVMFFPEDRRMLETFTLSMVQLMRKHIHVEVQFKYE